MELELDSVTKRYGPQIVLDRVSLRVRSGDLYGFIGHNGAGKTTAMRIALGLIRPDRGCVLVDGFDAARHPREARARMGGLIEVPGFYGTSDGRTNLVRLARLQGMVRREARREAERLLEVVGLGHAGRKPVASYSQGMRQRLGIAQAILGRPGIVLLDEPLNGLDPEGIGEMRSLLVRLTRDEGMTVLLSSHQLRELSDVCNRVGILREGRLLVEQPTGELLSGGRVRYRLETSDGEAVAAVLARLGVASEASPGGGCRVELGTRPPEDLARAVVEAGLGLRTLAPEAPTLEEVYLRFARATPGGGGEGTPGGGKPTRGKGIPCPRLAPPWPTLRMVRHEMTRWGMRLGPAFLLAAPAMVGIAAVIRRHGEAVRHAREVAGESLISTTGVTAFEGVGVALRAGLPLAVVVLAGLASLSLAGELGRGTLRNLLLRPLARGRNVAGGKALAILAIGLASYLLLAVAAVAASAIAFDFGDVSEILPGGQVYPLVSADRLWPQLARALASPLLPLAAYAGIGFAVGALCRTGTVALAASLGTVVLLDLGRVFARGPGLEGWLPSAHLPSLLGDTSFLRFYADAVQGVSNASFPHAGTAIAAPLVWAVATLALAGAALSRRSVP